MERLRPVWAVKAIVVIVFTSILFRCVCGANLTVGGASGWDLSSDVQTWSSTTTFNVGDDLVFSYTPLHDVVEVNQQGYDTCTIANAIATYNTGETVIHLTEEGSRYFVCGRMDHCQQGLKLEAQVLDPSNNNNNNGTRGDQEQRRRPTPRRRPPAPPRRLPPPLPDSPPDPGYADAPCHCSRAEESSELVPLITLVIILVLTRTRFFFAL